MRIIKKISSVIILLFILEILYTYVENSEYSSHWCWRLLIGLPFRSTVYTIHDFRDILEPSHPAQWEWQAGLEVYPPLLVIDVLFAALLALFIITVFPETLIKQSVQGGLLSSALAVVASFAVWVLPELVSLPDVYRTVVMAIIGFIHVIFIYFLSLRYKHQNLAIVYLSFISVAVLMNFLFFAIGFTGRRLDLEDMELGVFLRFWLFIGIFTIVYISVCFILKWFHKFILRKKKLAGYNKSLSQKVKPDNTTCLEQTQSKGILKKAIILSVLIIMTLYSGWHFRTVRKMEKDDYFLPRNISSKFRPSVTNKVSQLTIKTVSFNGGFNAIYRAEVTVNNEDVYDVELKKNIFIPWIQCEHYEVGNR